MFPSSGLFANILCPFSTRGLCERPHCPYKHVPEVEVLSGSPCEQASVDRAGVRNGLPSAICGTSVPETKGETKGDCIQELERINKEIETMKHEVEQEQRRLSRYQTADAEPHLSVSNSKPTGQNVNTDSYGDPSDKARTKVHSWPRKYVVDTSKPRTDLEYDPMSNFSACLSSYKSSGREQKAKVGHDLKRESNADGKAPPAHVVRSRSPSPELLDDTFEDGILVIDIPPSPDSKRSQAQEPVNPAIQQTPKDIEETSPALIPFDSLSMQRNEEAVVLPAKAKNICVCMAESEVSQNPCQNSVHETIPDENENVIDLTGSQEEPAGKYLETPCLQSVETEMLNGLTPASSSNTRVRQDFSRNELAAVEDDILPNRKSEMPLETKVPFSHEEADPPQIQNMSQNSHFDESQCSSFKHNQKPEQPAEGSFHQHFSPTQRSQKTSTLTRGVQGKAAANHFSPEPDSSSSHNLTCPLESSVDLNITAEEVLPISSTKKQAMQSEKEEVIIIDSTSDEESGYSNVEFSDSDPMEECYRIFMEANEERAKELPDAPTCPVEVEKPENIVKPQELLGKKRKAHEAKHPESLAKKPQVLVPLREQVASGSQSSAPTKIQQIQQKASMLTASVKGGQAFVSATCPRKPETHKPALVSSAVPTAEPASVKNAYMNYIPVGTTVLDVGNSLHLILPQGAIPLPITSSSGPVTSVFTPVTQAHVNPVAVREACPPLALTPMQRFRSIAPLLVPAPPRRPFSTPASLAASATRLAPQVAAHAAARPLHAKRKPKQSYETSKDKVPRDIRQRYISMFMEEFLKSANVTDAFEKALAEERAVYNRSMNRLKYLSIAVNALKRLKNQNAAAAKGQNKVTSQGSKGNIPLNLQKLRGDDDMALYESLKDYVLTEETLIENNYPVQHPEKQGFAVLFADNKKASHDALKKICCRCGATYSVSQTGKHIRREECNYHYGKGVENKVPGGVETRYSCCEGVTGAPGCQVFKLHVHDSFSLDGFVSTVPRRPTDAGSPGVYSLDCEMCYTIRGLELSRVTVVNSSLQVVYDTFVLPGNEVIDYNTRFSGISEQDMKSHHTSLSEVQKTLLSFISADTILIGHGLEMDLCALKLIHGMVVDTAVVFPHRLGPPHQLSLNSLTAEYLRRIIQESVCGHDCAEDAAACMELMLWKIKDGRLKK